MKGLSFAPLFPAVFLPSNVELEFFNSQVATFTNLSMSLSFENPVPAGSVVKITFPPEISIKAQGQVYLRSIYKSGKNKGNLDFTLQSS